MERREFLVNATAGVAAFAGLSRVLWAQRGTQPGLLPPTDWSADPGKPANASPAKLARLSIMTLNFDAILKLPVAPPNPNAAPNPATAAAAASRGGVQTPPPPRTLEVLDIPQMIADVYGVHNIEFQHSHFLSTEDAYLKELRAHIEKVKSRMPQINLEFGVMNISAPQPINRIQAIDLTKRWIDHAVMLNCPKVMVNQGQPSQENEEIAIATLKLMGEYGKSKGVKVSMETRGGGGGNRGRAGAPGGAAGAAPAQQPPMAPAAPAGPPAWILLKEIVERSSTYSNLDIGGAAAPNQEALHETAKALLPTNSGQTHIKVSANWDLGTFVKFYEGIGYKGLYTLEIRGHQPLRAVYDIVLENL